MPKPYAYPRLTYPSKGFQTFHAPDKTYQFEYPATFVPTLDKSSLPKGRWVDFRFERYGITLFTSYLQTANKTSLNEQIDRHEALLQKKIPPYSTIQKIGINQPDKSLSVYLYEISGNSATPFEFLITDNHNRLFSGNVLFDEVPDRDSLADVLNGLSKDMLHLMKTFRFRKPS
ncbi:MAG: hypothetical protein Q8914_08285 [Bacteroidota bacterium]|nr:hypothetical protein [Bacteroidota bacterium]